MRIKQKAGASALAYGLMVGLVAVVALAAVTSSGSSITSLFGGVGGNLDSVVNESPDPSPSASFDDAPDAFSFAPQTDINVSTQVETAIVLITGMNDATDIAISGAGAPEYRICADGACTSEAVTWTTGAGVIDADQYVQLRMTSSASVNTLNTATLTIGSVSANWDVTTAATALTGCAAILDGAPSSTNGTYSIDPDGPGGEAPYNVYCDMANGGWTLVSRYSNADAPSWITTSDFWYTTVGEVGAPTNPTQNSDMLSKAFWTLPADEMRVTRTDQSAHPALLTTTGSCIGGLTMRGKIQAQGNYLTGVAWPQDAVASACNVTFSGSYASTEGFAQAGCSSNIGNANTISFFADWSQGDGAVIMIGGGGSACARADHGIGVTEENTAMFSVFSGQGDFGDNASGGTTSYALNLWVK